MPSLKVADLGPTTKGFTFTDAPGSVHDYSQSLRDFATVNGELERRDDFGQGPVTRNTCHMHVVCGGATLIHCQHVKKRLGRIQLQIRDVCAVANKRDVL